MKTITIGESSVTGKDPSNHGRSYSYNAGETVSVPDAVAQDLIAARHAIYARGGSKPEKTVKAQKPAETTSKK